MSHPTRVVFSMRVGSPFSGSSAFWVKRRSEVSYMEDLATTGVLIAVDVAIVAQVVRLTVDSQRS
jgi:hypothetical protein